ncbi:MAG: hypothetical protein HY898_01710 [Deltaproteobacteria bacterium]|nr:hypothetical protein [Deltaproteobacteria bacterium]
MRKIRVKCLVVGTLAAAGVMLGAAGSAHAQIVADHTSLAKFGEVTPACVAQIKSTLHLSYGHTSHGSQIVTGMDVLATANALYKHADDRSHYENGGGSTVAADELSLWDAFPGYGASDLGNPDFTTWATATERMLSNSDNDFSIFPHLRNVVVWSWCGEVSNASQADIDTYTGLMTGLETKYPDVKFVYMTGHLDGGGESGNLNVRNNQIRDFVKQGPNRVLFDFADIESYDPDGAYFLDKNATDGCAYDGGNWATEWCTAHSGHELCADNSCAHSESLNCNVKARAFWWLLAQIAGCTPGDGGTGGSGGGGAGGAGQGGSGQAGAGQGGAGQGGSGTAGAGTGGTGTAGAGTGGAAGSTPPADGGTDAAAGSGATPPADDGGCSCNLVGTSPAPAAALLLALIPLLARRRRR